MARGTRQMRVTGLTELVKQLESMTGNTTAICEDITYEGINVIADAMKEQLNSLKTTDDYSTGSSKRYAADWEKEALVDSMGITPVQWSGSKVDYKVGFDGYAPNTQTEKYPNGKANAMIANSINAGTSYMQSQPFIKKTMSAGRKAAIAQMETELQEQINKYMK